IQFSQFQNVLLGFAQLFSSLTWRTQFLVFFVSGFQALAIPTFLSGALFPLVVKRLTEKGIAIEQAVGATYAYNTMGGILGSLAAGFFLIPIFGTQTSLLILAFLNLSLG